MFGFLNKKSNRITVRNNDIFINNQNRNIGVQVNKNHVFEFTQSIPEINVFENEELVRSYKIEALKNNPDLNGQFLHSSIIIQSNNAVMIDGIMSLNNKTVPKWTHSNYEAIRLQPFYLSNANEFNLALVGKGLFGRGLHFIGTITPTTVRNVCICDYCSKSFNIQHFHAGFSDCQYFYSSDSKETLVVRYGGIEGLPVQLQKDIDLDTLKGVESELPKPLKGKGSFGYYNSFKCPHCLMAYIDFENHKEIRPGEYYGNFYINEMPQYHRD